MGRFCYPSTDRITYLYPKALEEARGLDAPVDDPGRVSILPNGTVLSEFNEQYALRLEETQRIAALTPEGPPDAPGSWCSSPAWCPSRGSRTCWMPCTC
ncbi:hypothetical protein A5N15_03445 [Rothia kristinae]|uniref:Uncharacterized protein n=1 Tax=Rothia kristinae TaxID=37923 RepID=A0A657IVT4_9MICC|nr:hypothetical protein A5N15_03445 [Rothia kristinae]